MMRTGRRWYWLCLVSVVLALAVYTLRRDVYGLYLDYKASGERVETLERDLRSAAAARASLEKQVEYLNSSPLEMEAAIRRSKSLVRAGEIVFRVELPEDALE